MKACPLGEPVPVAMRKRDYLISALFEHSPKMRLLPETSWKLELMDYMTLHPRSLFRQTEKLKVMIPWNISHK